MDISQQCWFNEQEDGKNGQYFSHNGIWTPGLRNTAKKK